MHIWYSICKLFVVNFLKNYFSIVFKYIFIVFAFIYFIHVHQSHCVNGGNSFLDFIHGLNPASENESNLIEHSCYIDQEFKSCMTRGNDELRMLNLNVGGLNAKFDKLKRFLAECNNDTSLL